MKTAAITAVGKERSRRSTNETDDGAVMKNSPNTNASTHPIPAINVTGPNPR